MVFAWGRVVRGGLLRAWQGALLGNEKTLNAGCNQKRVVGKFHATSWQSKSRLFYHLVE